MKTLASGIPASGHMNYLPKLRLNRTRTCSSDSGCDVFCDSPDLSSTIMEDSVQTWEVRLDGVVKQEVERAREVTTWAKEALRHANEDEEKKQEVLESWRSQLEGIMEFTKDLVECVNNDTKEVMYDSMGLSSGHLSNSTIEELEEDDEEKEEEIMQLFLLSAMGGNKNGHKRGKNGSKSLMKEFMSIYKKNGKVFKNSRKASKEVQTAYSKIKRQESFTKRRLSYEEIKFTNDYISEEDFLYSQKMFDSVLDSAEIFNDWHWNLNENESYENIFADWRWNFDVQVDLKVKYYDDPEIDHEWNEFNFWKIRESYENLRVELDSGCLGDSEEDKVWTNCKFWQNSNDNENILHCLVDDVIEEDGTKDVTNFWDENMANQSILESLIEDEEKVSSDKKEIDDEFIWEAKDIAMSLIDIEPADEAEQTKENPYIWNDLETITSLLKVKDDEEPKTYKTQDLFPWEDPNYIQMLIKDDEKNDLMSFPDENEDFFSCDDHATNSYMNSGKNKNLKGLSENKNEKTDWTSWPFWNEFGPISDIIDAHEEKYKFGINYNQRQKYLDFNIQELFWDISLEDRRLSASSHSVSWNPTESSTIKQHKNTPKDPANIFKSFKHVFTIPSEYKGKNVSRQQVEETHLFEDMEDVYGDWALLALCDERSEKKRQLRGRKKERNAGVSNKENDSKSGLGHRRPGTPTIQTVIKQSSNKLYDFDSCWIETKVPKKERKTAHVSKNARSQKRLNAKIYAKQPRSMM
eukprot:GFUD01106575.1.p1 GENE.GFUD01106575.1~~GFUD01106575.1.p1  ORF type:complete len:750 (-),score=216.39 GFUD01106575.1:1605-3854(-)